MATCKDCLHFNDCLSYGKTRYYGENSACNDVQERCQYFKNKENFAEVCRCKDCLYFEYKEGETPANSLTTNEAIVYAIQRLIDTEFVFDAGDASEFITE